MRTNIPRTLSCLTVFWACIGGALVALAASARPLVFPLPQEMEATGDYFPLDQQAVILVPEAPSDNDLFLARFLMTELSDRYQFALPIKRASSIPAGRQAIVMGSIDNPLVRQYCRENKLKIDAETPGPEGYVLRAGKGTVVVAGSDEIGRASGRERV